MATDLKGLLVAARAALVATSAGGVYFRGDHPDTPPATFFLLDVISAASQAGFNMDVQSPLQLRVGAWVSLTTDSTGIADALDLQEEARVALLAIDYRMGSGPFLDQDERFGGVLYTYELPAAFDAFGT